MKKGYQLLKRYGITFLSCALLSVAATVYAEETAPGVKGMSEEEFTPAEEVLTVKYVLVDKPYHMDVESLHGYFSDAQPVDVQLQIQDKAFPNGGGSVSSANVKAIHDGMQIYFQVTWNDPTKNAKAIAIQEFRDAVALMFPLGAVEITPADHFSPRMGDREKPVNLWHWKADWEADLLAKGELEDVEVQYPNMHDDFNFNPYSAYYHRDLITSIAVLSGGRAAHNLFSQPGRGRTVEDLNAEGFGTLTSQEHQDVNGCSRYKDGVWTVIFYRPLITNDPHDVQFIPGGKTFFNMAVWNGGEADRNGQKNISIQWHPAILEKVAWQ
ncbi:MAG: ethylbenzene dehydrogenase-related protein [Candidatus Loosdrechtia sp.]|uniref:ethylbenzene dehydrogenase-related protein n=1 Tax=Candidatus Loosdrechtia sp. TaxID=3101272 RepID=UPI003A708E9E|nr:MAG: ethylbenzene dehydrogenase-related protein [Candidatus Jettenia sp. AMX2]